MFKQLFGGKKQSGEGSLSVLKTDLHSHLIPGIDDGSPDLETSLEMIRGLMELGYRKFITTPHIMSDAYPNTPEIIRAGLDKLREAVAEAGLDVKLEAAAEYYLDEIFIANLDKVELLTFGGERKFLLFETSYISRPMSLGDTIFRLQSLGYSPVMAHPERYQFFWRESGVDEIRGLRNRGLKMQVNLASFTGRQGRRAAIIAREMAKEGMIDFLGSDLHRPSQVATVGKAPAASKELRQLLQNATLLNQEL
ncbi:MAG TPA: capsular biosynthesis protein [Bacteroidetes bacterium]|nr:capsular biosynthesis protein [Bacteroidota bacterium]